MRAYNIVFLLVVFSCIQSFGQVSTVQAGKWYWASTWENGVVPDSNTSIIVNHDINLDGSGSCYNITINSSGRIHDGSIWVYGSLSNSGTINGLDEWYGMKIFVRGNLSNSGYFDSEIEFNGASNQSVYSSDTLRIGYCYKRNPATKLIFEDPIILKGGFLFLQQSNLILQKNLVLVNSGIDGGLISANGNEIHGANSTFGWHGAISFGPDATTINNAVLDGYLMFMGDFSDSTQWTTTLSGNTINNGTITTYPHFTGNTAYIKIRGNFTNNGSIESLSYGTYLDFIDGDFTNNGNLSNKRITFTNQHKFINNSTDSLNLEEIYLSNENTRVEVEGNLIFTKKYNRGSILTNGGVLVLQENSELTNFGLKTEFGAANSIIEANNAVISYNPTIGSSRQTGVIRNAKIKLLRYYYVLEGNTEVSEGGSLINQMDIYGNFVNNGTVEDSHNIMGNLINNGTWKAMALLKGTENQKITFGENSTFENFIQLYCEIDGSAYQWEKDGVNIDNAIYQTYRIEEVTKEAEGIYQCIIDETQHSRAITIGEDSGSSHEQIVIMSQHFDSFDEIADWTLINTHETQTWALGNITDHSFTDIDTSNVYSVVCPYIAEDQDEFFISPKFSLGKGNAYVEFYSGYDSEWLTNAKLILMLVTNNGQNWNQIWEFDTATNGWQWKNFTVDLTPYSNQSDIQLAFEYIGNNGDFVALDNMVIKGYEYITAIENDNNSSIPSQFSLSQNYPNPFNPSTIISYQLPVNSLVKLNVFDMLGREVNALVNEEQAAGTYTVQFDASKLSSGIYFYNISTGKFKKTMKMILIK